MQGSETDQCVGSVLPVDRVSADRLPGGADLQGGVWRRQRDVDVRRNASVDRADYPARRVSAGHAGDRVGRGSRGGGLGAETGPEQDSVCERVCAASAVPGGVCKHADAGAVRGLVVPACWRHTDGGGTDRRDQ